MDVDFMLSDSLEVLLFLFLTIVSSYRLLGRKTQVRDRQIA